MSQTMPRPSMDSVVLTTLFGALAGALVWWPLLMVRVLAAVPASYQTWPLILLMHLGGAVFSVACALAALWIRYRPVGNIELGLARVGTMFAVGATTATVATVTFARLADFSSGSLVVATEVGIALTCCTLGASVGAAWWRGGQQATHKH